MVDAQQSSRRSIRRLSRLEFDVPYPTQIGAAIYEIDEAAADPAHGRDLQLPGTHRLVERLVEQGLRPTEGSGGIVNHQADGAHPGPVHDIVRMREAFLLGVDDNIDRTLRPSRHRLGFVHTGARKPE